MESVRGEKKFDSRSSYRTSKKDVEVAKITSIYKITFEVFGRNIYIRKGEVSEEEKGGKNSNFWNIFSSHALNQKSRELAPRLSQFSFSIYPQNIPFTNASASIPLLLWHPCLWCIRCHLSRVVWYGF